MPNITLDDVTVVRLDERFNRQARSLLYHSYKDEPTFKYLLDAHRPGYKQRIRATIRELIRLHMDRGEFVFGVIHKAEDRLLGVAFFSDLQLKMEISKQLVWRLKMILTAGFAGTRRCVKYFNDVQESLPSKNHRMVSLIGIHPDFQKQGLGKLLLESIHAISDQDDNSIGLFLDTGNNRYLDFYRSLGYEVFTELPLGQLKEFVLFRPNPNYINRTG
ncbi:GNAT family N-acetyltransferase [Reinekea sp.]|uniref:GNAT family N-acetyltransferase n=1 Tax=Reinekea sp. TaxID=1970455 RepID=UPI002A822F7D|nr:GNAT family N-acetyltransferase [Reinekea sp.]